MQFTTDFSILNRILTKYERETNRRLDLLTKENEELRKIIAGLETRIEETRIEKVKP